MLDSLQQLNRMTQSNLNDPETATRIAQYEMAFRMQASVPELTDLSGETAATLEMYGPSVNDPGSFRGTAPLLARRLVERGVRVVQLLHRGWDQHGDLPRQIGNQCQQTDQPIAALIERLETTRDAGEYAGRLGRRVWPHGLQPRRLVEGTTTDAITIRGTSACGWPVAA
jgi:hypothetical protein